MDRYYEMLQHLPAVGNSVQNVLDQIGSSAVAHSDVITVALVVIILLVAMQVALRLLDNNQPINKAEEMRKRLILESMYANMIHDGLLDKLHAGEIDKHEYRRACRRFGLAFRLPDLLTRKSKKHGLRYIVRKNVAEMHATPSVQGRIPGPKIGEEVPASPLVIKPLRIQRKVWVVAGKALLRRKSA